MNMKVILFCMFFSARTVFGQDKPEIEISITKGQSSDVTPLKLDSNNAIVITEDMVLSGAQYNNVILLCKASYPVEWWYEGTGSPRLFTTQIREFKDIKDASTYTHVNMVGLFQERFNEEQTGTYTCRGVDNPSNSVSFHIYFAGDFGFPSVNNVVVQPKAGDKTATLPCQATNPEDAMQLFKINPNGREPDNLTEDRLVSYDPKKGFMIDLEQTSSPYGLYYCRAGEKTTFWTIELVEPKDTDVKYTPNSNYVSMAGGEVELTCKSKENIFITSPNTSPPDSISYSENSEDEYPFTATVTIQPENSNDYKKINCITRRSHRILHSWELSNVGPEDITVRFDKAERRVLCCSNSKLTPIHQLAKCSTVTDCQIKQNCFDTGRCEYNFPPKFVDAPRGCTAVQFTDAFPTHAMKCHIGNGEIAEATSKTYFITSTINDDEIILSNGTMPEADKLLRMVQLGPKQGDEIRVMCHGNTFYLSTKFVFAMEKGDGTMEYFDEDLIQNGNTYRPVLKANVPSDTKKLHCFAPVTRSNEWKSVSMDL